MLLTITHNSETIFETNNLVHFSAKLLEYGFDLPCPVDEVLEAEIEVAELDPF